MFLSAMIFYVIRLLIKSLEMNWIKAHYVTMDRLEEMINGLTMSLEKLNKEFITFKQGIETNKKILE